MKLTPRCTVRYTAGVDQKESNYKSFQTSCYLTVKYPSSLYFEGLAVAAFDDLTMTPRVSYTGVMTLRVAIPHAVYLTMPSFFYTNYLKVYFCLTSDGFIFF